MIFWGVLVPKNISVTHVSKFWGYVSVLPIFLTMWWRECNLVFLYMYLISRTDFIQVVLGKKMPNTASLLFLTVSELILTSGKYFKIKKEGKKWRNISNNMLFQHTGLSKHQLIGGKKGQEESWLKNLSFPTFWHVFVGLLGVQHCHPAISSYFWRVVSQLSHSLSLESLEKVIV